MVLSVGRSVVSLHGLSSVVSLFFLSRVRVCLLLAHQANQNQENNDLKVAQTHETLKFTLCHVLSIELCMHTRMVD